MILFYLIIGSILLGISEVLRYYVEPNEKNELVRKKINTVWHIFRDLAIVCYFLLGWVFPDKLLYAATWVPLLITLHWILSDGVQNLIKGKTFFYISKTSGNYVENLGSWQVKLTLLLIGILIKIFENNIFIILNVD